MPTKAAGHRQSDGGTSISTNKLANAMELVIELVIRDFKLRYKRSILGIAWSLLVPLSQLLVLYFVFKLVLPLNIDRYTSFLFTGLLPWFWFHSALTTATTTIVDNRDLVRQVGFSPAILPLVAVISQMIHFILALPMLAIVLMVDGWKPTPSLGVLPFVIVIQFVFTLGIAYLASMVYVKFRDTQYLLGLALFLLFYLTPVFYDPSVVPPDYALIYGLNPMARILATYRNILMEGTSPAPSLMLTMSIVSTLTLYTGYVVFRRAQVGFIEDI